MELKNKGTRKCQNCKTRFKQFKFTDKYCSAPECQSLKNSKKTTKIRPVSAKRFEQNLEYKIIRDKFLSKNTHCERCNAIATEVHHTNDRFGERLIDVKYFKATCSDCHKWAHSFPEQATIEGWLV